MNDANESASNEIAPPLRRSGDAGADASHRLCGKNSRVGNDSEADAWDFGEGVMALTKNLWRHLVSAMAVTKAPRRQI